MELSVENLGVARGGIAILEGVSFRLRAGEALVLRGPNGAGKTTLLRTVAGLQPPQAGHISLDRDAMAYAGHADGLKSSLTVAENLRFWAEVFGTSDISSVLTAYDLLPLADRRAGNLSAGQKRRLGLARMLVTGRAVWVMDEPTVSLDTTATALFAAAVKRHLDAGGMALLATHIDLGLPQATTLDVGPFRAKQPALDDFDEVFL
ncbi:MAG TPA: heme ABC exporter ATP-binding protein CcmA [Rhodobacteraceae bacterium]|jgi:heme exporter protein A|nr:heme ABC exporter ATP-binding protein CcmA [Paracoccaceae bacterium]HBV53736.1 heme ABC exporter ATP-binding protein CcmA [Paracoccaceae bacterium]